MCLIAFALEAHRDYPLILAANRDEFYDRPTARAGWWSDAPEIYGGRDLSAGGSWLALDRRGRLAVLTNVRDGLAVGGRLSRGLLVAARLATHESPVWSASDHLGPPGHAGLGDLVVGGPFDRVGTWGRDHAGFNLLQFELDRPAEPDQATRVRAAWCSNREGADARWSPGGQSTRPGPGLHTLSNAVLDVPWPKTERLAAALAQAMALSPRQALIDALLQALADQQTAAPGALPHTGVGTERERMLSPVFIAGPGYGTRTSTVVLVDRSGRVDFVERDATPGVPAPAIIATHFDLAVRDDNPQAD